MPMENEINRRQAIKSVAIGSGIVAASDTVRASSRDSIDATTEIPNTPLSDRPTVTENHSRFNPLTIDEAGDTTTLADPMPSNGGVRRWNWSNRLVANGMGGGSEWEIGVSWVDIDVGHDNRRSSEDYFIDIRFDIDGKLTVRGVNLWGFPSDGRTGDVQGHLVPEQPIDTQKYDTETDYEVDDLGEMSGITASAGTSTLLDLGKFLLKGSGHADYSVGVHLWKFNKNTGSISRSVNATAPDLFGKSIGGRLNNKSEDISISPREGGAEIQVSAYGDEIIRVIVGARVAARSAGLASARSDFRTSGRKIDVEELKIWKD